MSAEKFDVQLLKVSLDVPMKHRIDDGLENLVVVTTPVQARRGGQSIYTSEGKRFPQDQLSKIMVLAEGMLPDFCVFCAPEDLEKAVELIHEALRKRLHYYAVVARAAEKPLMVQTKEQFNENLLRPKAKSDPDAS